MFYGHTGFRIKQCVGILLYIGADQKKNPQKNQNKKRNEVKVDNMSKSYSIKSVQCGKCTQVTVKKYSNQFTQVFKKYVLPHEMTMLCFHMKSTC